MDRAEVCLWLGIDDEQLSRLLGRGLPCGPGNRYDADAVADWLQTNGLAEPVEPALPPGVVRTQRELAAALDRSRPTISAWLDAGAPGRPGHYDIAAVRAWRAQRDREIKRAGTAGPACISDARLGHILKVYLAWERVELQSHGVGEPKQTRQLVRTLYSVMTLLDAAGLDVGSPQPALLEALGLTAAAAECEAWYQTAEGAAYTDAFERLSSGMPCY